MPTPNFTQQSTYSFSQPPTMPNNNNTPAPVMAAVEWDRYIHEESGKSYFHNRADNFTQWEVPSAPNDHITWFPSTDGTTAATTSTVVTETETTQRNWVSAASKHTLITELRNSFNT